MSTDLLADAPANIRALRRDVRGFPVPWFVKWYGDKPDFRVIDEGKFNRAIAGQRCWICGDRLGRYMSFVVGPMCTVNRVSSEPPSHRACAIYAATHCPFLVTPRMHRREKGLPEHQEMAGTAILDNPGACAVWTTLSFNIVAVPNGRLIEMGEPTDVAWFAETKPATRAQVIDAMEKGLPKLTALCRNNQDHVLLEDMTRRARRWIPREETEDAATADRYAG